MKKERRMIKGIKGGKRGKEIKENGTGRKKQQPAERMEEGSSNEGKRDGCMFYSLTANTPLITAAKITARV